jgi:hypothetical protein
MGTAEEVAVHLDAMANDPALAMFADRSHRLDRTFETVEAVTRAGGYDLEALVIFIATNFTRGHRTSLLNSALDAGWHS